MNNSEVKDWMLSWSWKYREKQ